MTNMRYAQTPKCQIGQLTLKVGIVNSGATLTMLDKALLGGVRCSDVFIYRFFDVLIFFIFVDHKQSIYLNILKGESRKRGCM